MKVWKFCRRYEDFDMEIVTQMWLHEWWKDLTVFIISFNPLLFINLAYFTVKKNPDMAGMDILGLR